MPLIDRMDDLALEATWEDLPKMTGWFKRSKAHASFGKAFYPMPGLSEFLSIAPLRPQRNDQKQSATVALLIGEMK